MCLIKEMAPLASPRDHRKSETLKFLRELKGSVPCKRTLNLENDGKVVLACMY